MKKSWLLLLAAVLPLYSQERFPLFSEDLSFYQGFEDSIDADLERRQGETGSGKRGRRALNPVCAAGRCSAERAAQAALPAERQSEFRPSRNHCLLLPPLELGDGKESPAPVFLGDRIGERLHRASGRERSEKHLHVRTRVSPDASVWEIGFRESSIRRLRPEKRVVPAGTCWRSPGREHSCS